MLSVEYNDIVYGSSRKHCWVLRTHADHVAIGRRNSVIGISSGRQRHAFSGWVSSIVHLRRQSTMPHRPTFYSLASENLQFATWTFFSLPTYKRRTEDLRVRTSNARTDRGQMRNRKPRSRPRSHLSHRMRLEKTQQSKRTITAHAHRGSSSCPRGSRRRRRYHRGDQRRRPGRGPRSDHRGPPGKRSGN